MPETELEFSMLTSIGVALRHGFLTAPAMRVRGKQMKRVVSRQKIIDVLSKV